MSNLPPVGSEEYNDLLQEAQSGVGEMLHEIGECALGAGCSYCEAEEVCGTCHVHPTYRDGRCIRCHEFERYADDTPTFSEDVNHDEKWDESLRCGGGP